MRVVILAIGTTGDVLPCVALGNGLKKAGYQVDIGTHRCYAGFVEAAGLGYRFIAGEPDKWADGTELIRLASSGKSFRSWMVTLRALAQPLLDDIFNSCWEACPGADVVIYSPLAWIGYSIAEKLGVPSIFACLQPLTPTRAFPSPFYPAAARLGGAYNLFTFHLIRQLFWHVNRPFISDWRKKCGLPSLPFFGPFRHERWRRQLNLCGFSPLLIPQSGDWPENTRTTGFWFLPEADAPPDKNLEHFLAQGPPPVYIGFGSMSEQHPTHLKEVALRALQLTGQRAVVQGRWIFKGELPDNVYLVNWISHDWLFPRCSLAVHHGGGTTARSLKAGIPTLAIPYAWDQFFWGQRIYELGVGPKPISRKDLTSENLARAIEACASNEALRAKAQELGARLRGENGVENAVKAVTEYVRSFQSSAQ